METETLTALRSAMETSGTTKDEVRDLCRFMFSKSKFTDLNEAQQWSLVCAVWPDVAGPYGCTMAPF